MEIERGTDVPLSPRSPDRGLTRTGTASEWDPVVAARRSQVVPTLWGRSPTSGGQTNRLELPLMGRLPSADVRGEDVRNVEVVGSNPITSTHEVAGQLRRGMYALHTFIAIEPDPVTFFLGASRLLLHAAVEAHEWNRL